MVQSRFCDHVLAWLFIPRSEGLLVLGQLLLDVLDQVHVNAVTADVSLHERVEDDAGQSQKLQLGAHSCFHKSHKVPQNF